METLQLIQMLYHKEAGIRRQATLIIGMVEETTALGALEQRTREEQDSNILKMIMWAGKRVKQADQRGYSTIDAIFDHFHINQELASGIDPEEAQLLRHQKTLQSTPQSGGIFGDIRLGSMMTAENIKTDTLGKRSSDNKMMLRLPPIQPTDRDISIKVKRLLDSSDAKRQKNAALELRDINNPQALPYLALVYFRNENPDHHSLIEQCGKIIYWNVNYAAMERNGRLNLEIAKRRRENGYPQPASVTEAHKPEVEQPSVTDILNQAQQHRKRRKR